MAKNVILIYLMCLTLTCRSQKVECFGYSIDHCMAIKNNFLNFMGFKN